MIGRYSRVIMIFLILAGSGLSGSRSYGDTVLTYDAADMRDPFVPLIAGQKRLSVGLEAVETIDDVKFEGLIFDPSGTSIAVINGELVREGDKINNVEIVKIAGDTIIMKIYERIYTIALDKEGGD